jgi:hypothetical protein
LIIIILGDLGNQSTKCTIPVQARYIAGKTCHADRVLGEQAIALIKIQLVVVTTCQHVAVYIQCIGCRLQVTNCGYITIHEIRCGEPGVRVGSTHLQTNGAFPCKGYHGWFGILDRDDPNHIRCGSLLVGPVGVGEQVIAGNIGNDLSFNLDQ